MLRSLISRFTRGAGATRPATGSRPLGGVGGVGGAGRAGTHRTQDEAIGRGVRGLFKRLR